MFIEIVMYIEYCRSDLFYKMVHWCKLSSRRPGIFCEW